MPTLSLPDNYVLSWCPPSEHNSLGNKEAAKKMLWTVSWKMIRISRGCEEGNRWKTNCLDELPQQDRRPWQTHPLDNDIPRIRARATDRA